MDENEIEIVKATEVSQGEYVAAVEEGAFADDVDWQWVQSNRGLQLVLLMHNGAAHVMNVTPDTQLMRLARDGRTVVQDEFDN